MEDPFDLHLEVTVRFGNERVFNQDSFMCHTLVSELSYKLEEMGFIGGRKLYRYELDIEDKPLVIADGFVFKFSTTAQAVYFKMRYG